MVDGRDHFFSDQFRALEFHLNESSKQNQKDAHDHAQSVSCSRNQSTGQRTKLAMAAQGGCKLHDLEDSSVVRMRTSLLSWYDENKRDLPWRKKVIIFMHHRHCVNE